MSSQRWRQTETVSVRRAWVRLFRGAASRALEKAVTLLQSSRMASAKPMATQAVECADRDGEPEAGGLRCDYRVEIGQEREHGVLPFLWGIEKGDEAAFITLWPTHRSESFFAP